MPLPLCRNKPKFVQIIELIITEGVVPKTKVESIIIGGNDHISPGVDAIRGAVSDIGVAVKILRMLRTGTHRIRTQPAPLARGIHAEVGGIKAGF